MRVHSVLKGLMVMTVTFITIAVIVLGVTHNPYWLITVGANVFSLLVLVYLFVTTENGS